MKITVNMKLERETKGTVLFKADDPNAAISSLYVKKPDGQKLSQSISVTVADN